MTVISVCLFEGSEAKFQTPLGSEGSERIIVAEWGRTGLLTGWDGFPYTGRPKEGQPFPSEKTKALSLFPTWNTEEPNNQILSCGWFCFLFIYLLLLRNVSLYNLDMKYCLLELLGYNQLFELPLEKSLPKNIQYILFSVQYSIFIFQVHGRMYFFSFLIQLYNYYNWRK